MSTEEKALANAFTGENIAKMLRTTGPIVKCVLLKCAAQDAKIAATDDETTSDIPRNVFEEWIEEIEVDTTPKKSQVQEILKGPFTFLGQYEDEGIMVIVRRNFDQPVDEDDVLNQHPLQPPLHNAKVYGDILLMRVAHSDNDDDDGNGDTPETIMSNEDFFLDYTKNEYVEFAKRTDIVATEPEEEEGEEEDAVSGEEEEEEEASDDDDEENDNDDDSDNSDGSDDSDEYEPNEDEEDEEMDEETKVGMMNMILSQVLQRFREDNGRGPDTQELLSIRSALAEKLGIDTSLVNPPEVDNDEEGKSASPVKDKRPLDNAASPDSSDRKSVV